MPDPEDTVNAVPFGPLALKEDAFPSRARRLVGVLRGRRVVLPVIVVLVLGADAWMVAVTSGWRTEADDLRAEATSLGESIGAAVAAQSSLKNETELVNTRTGEASRVRGEVSVDAEVEQAAADALRDLTTSLRACADSRLAVIDGLWSHGSGFVADLAARTDAECAAAETRLAALLAAEG